MSSANGSPEGLHSGDQGRAHGEPDEHVTGSPRQQVPDAPREARLGQSRERTLRAAWMLSAWAPFTSFAAYWTGGTAILLGDFLRRTSEFIGIFVSWVVVRRSGGAAEGADLSLRQSDDLLRREAVASLVTATAMIVSACVIAVRAVSQALAPEPPGNLALGLFIASAGLLVNLVFWRRFARLTSQQPTPVVEAQWRLYRAKTATDCAVLTVLVLRKAWPSAVWLAYLDALASIGIGLLLVASGIAVVRRSMAAMVQHSISDPTQSH
jgi:ferrous-iron efflux pump FieF